MSNYNFKRWGLKKVNSFFISLIANLVYKSLVYRINSGTQATWYARMIDSIKKQNGFRKRERDIGRVERSTMSLKSDQCDK